MSRILTIAWREFKHTAMTKAFIFGAVVFPILMWTAFPLIASLTQTKVPPLEGRVVLVDETGEVFGQAEALFTPSSAADNLRDAAEGAINSAQRSNQDAEAALDGISELRDAATPVNLTVEKPPAEWDIESLKKQVLDGELVAAAVIDSALLDVDRIRRADSSKPEPTIELITSADIKPSHSRIIKRRLGDAVTRARAERLGEDIDMLEALLKTPRFSSVALTDAGEEVKDQTDLKEFLPFAFLILLWLAAFTSGQYLLTTTIEEKSNRVMEVLLSAVSPTQLMIGKILGQGLVSVVMLVMYGGLAVGGLIALSSLNLINPLHMIWFGLFFVMAYLFTAATMASIGSAVNDLHEAQSLMMPAMMVLVFGPMLLMFPASQDPSGVIATVTSFIPPVIPYVMIVRITAGEVPLWQIMAALVIGAFSVWVALWMAGKIFRVGVLMTGKPPSPLQLLKWVRYQ